MKKTLAVVLSLVLVLSVCFVPAFADEKSVSYKDLYDEVVKKVDGARDYVFNEKSSFAADEASNFLLYIMANGDVSPEMADAFANSFNKALAEGTIDDASKMAAAIGVLTVLDKCDDPAAYKANDTTYNLYELAQNCSVHASSPYLYDDIFYANSIKDDEGYKAFCKTCLDEILGDYTKGQGFNYWGYSCDNTAHFVDVVIDAVTYDVVDIEDVQDVLDDALNLLDTYKMDGGYKYADTAYDGTPITAPNADSTAAALMAFSQIGDLEKANEAYEMLKNFEVKDKNGEFGYMDNEDVNLYATKDALTALVEYGSIVGGQIEDEEGTTEAVTENATTTAAATTSTVTATPDTGDNGVIYVVFAGASVLAAGVFVALKKAKKVNE